jgi:hypothetical protein
MKIDYLNESYEEVKAAMDREDAELGQKQSRQLKAAENELLNVDDPAEYMRRRKDAPKLMLGEADAPLNDEMSPHDYFIARERDRQAVREVEMGAMSFQDYCIEREQG